MKTKAVEQLILGYTAAWSEPDPKKRIELLNQVWEEDGEYTDPMMHATNRSSLDRGIASFLADNPGASFSLDGNIDQHHHYVRFFWILQLYNGSQVKGMDYGEISPNGKLRKIVGFF